MNALSPLHLSSRQHDDWMPNTHLICDNDTLRQQILALCDAIHITPQNTRINDLLGDASKTSSRDLGVLIIGISATTSQDQLARNLKQLRQSSGHLRTLGVLPDNASIQMAPELLVLLDEVMEPRSDLASARLQRFLQRHIQDLKKSSLVAYLDSSQDGHFIWCLLDNDVRLSRRVLEITDMPADTPQLMALTDCLENVHSEDLPGLQHTLNQHLLHGLPFRNVTCRLRTGLGGFRKVSCNGQAIFDSRNKALVFAGSITDQSAIEYVNGLREAAENRYSILFQNLSDALVLTDPQSGLIMDVNAAAERLWQTPREQLIGRHQLSLYPPAEDDAGSNDELFLDHVRRLRDSQHSVIKRLRILTGTGRLVPVEVSARWYEMGNTNYVLGLFRDVTDQQRAQEAIYKLAYYDTLTSLGNRRLLQERLDQALQRCESRQHFCALMFIDLDRFKGINDTLGHLVGDDLLKEVAQRINRSVRSQDTVARSGGDEFVVLLESLSGEETQAQHQAQIIARKILRVLAQPFVLKGQAWRISASIGVRLFCNAELSADRLMGHADLAMYHSKNTGRNRVCFYRPALQANENQRLDLENSLESGLALTSHAQAQAHDTEGAPALDAPSTGLADQLQLVFAPQTGADGHLQALHAQINWQHPKHGLIEASRVFELVHETGLGDTLQQWLVTHVIEAALDLQRKGLTLPPDVELSLPLVTQPSSWATLVEHLRALRTRHPRVLKALRFEIAEDTLVNPDTMLAPICRDLAELGIKLSICDFGHSYSTLTLLHDLPADTLKLSSNLVEQIGETPRAAQLASVLVRMGHDLGLRVVAPAVNSTITRDQLMALGCSGLLGSACGPTAPLAHWAT